MGRFADSANVDYHLSITDQEKTNFRSPFAENKRKFAISIFCLQQTNESCRFPLVPISYVYFETVAYLYIDII